jgi:hypothetical protein
VIGAVEEPSFASPFDVIMFNVPWPDGTPTIRYDIARLDPEFGTLRQFVAGC